jgi:hypothetical protein
MVYAFTYFRVLEKLWICHKIYLQLAWNAKHLSLMKWCTRQKSIQDDGCCWTKGLASTYKTSSLPAHYSLNIYIYIFLVTFLKIYATDVRKKKAENGNGEKIEVAMSAQYRLNLPIVADERKVCLYSLWLIILLLLF